jgi:hypothetical protein
MCSIFLARSLSTRSVMATPTHDLGGFTTVRVQDCKMRGVGIYGFVFKSTTRSNRGPWPGIKALGIDAVPKCPD